MSGLQRARRNRGLTLAGVVGFGLAQLSLHYDLDAITILLVVGACFWTAGYLWAWEQRENELQRLRRDLALTSSALEAARRRHPAPRPRPNALAV